MSIEIKSEDGQGCAACGAQPSVSIKADDGSRVSNIWVGGRCLVGTAVGKQVVGGGPRASRWTWAFVMLALTAAFVVTILVAFR